MAEFSTKDKMSKPTTIQNRLAKINFPKYVTFFTQDGFLFASYWFKMKQFNRN